MKNYAYALALVIQLFSGSFQVFSQYNRIANQSESRQSRGQDFLSENENEFYVTNEHLEFARSAQKCSSNLISQRVYEEYGSVFSANSDKVKLPNSCFFQNDEEVKRFQNQIKISKVTIDGINVELQKEALRSYVAARAEAKKSGLDITPRFEDASRRSFADTLKLWREQVINGLTYWAGKNKLKNKEVSKIRALSIDKQITEVLKLEENEIYFGNGYKKSILQSVAAPGKSQHNLLLALDINEFDNPRIREILAKYGWFQTVKNDSPHFTFLGLKESQLSSFGMKRSVVGGREIWIVKPQLKSAPSIEKTVLTLPTENIPATMSEDVILPVTVEPLLAKLTQKYFAATGKRLHITSGFRTPERQAQAMFFNLYNYGVQYVANTYGGRAAVWEIIQAFRENYVNEKKAVSEMAKIIKAQIKRRIIISPHILEKAFDIRSRGKEGANLSVLTRIVAGMRGEVVGENDHYHVQF